MGNDLPDDVLVLARNALESGDPLHGNELNPFLLVIEKSQNAVAYLVRVEIKERAGFEEAYDEDVEQFLPDVPV